jgi:hypothetical protein
VSDIREVSPLFQMRYLCVSVVRSANNLSELYELFIYSQVVLQRWRLKVRAEGLCIGAKNKGPEHATRH